MKPKLTQEQEEQTKWINVEDATPKPEELVWAAYERYNSYLRVTYYGLCKAFYVPANTIKVNDYFVEEGWYEIMKHGSEDIYCNVQSKVTKWMPLELHEVD